MNVIPVARIALMVRACSVFPLNGEAIMDVVNVREALDQLFPGYLSPARATEWEPAKARFPLGSKAQGKVVAQFPFGVAVDIDAGFPALILVTGLRHADQRRYTSGGSVLPIGSTVEGRVYVWVDPQRQIGLTQLEKESMPGGC